MGHLVALDLPPGQPFVDAMLRCWDSGDAVLPIDQRLPPAAKAELLAALQPDLVRDPAGTHTRADGRGTEGGDALVMATSGSSGTPKGVILTHDAVRASASATAARLGTTSADTWVACLPFAHVGGLSVVTRALHTGAGLVVHDHFDAAAVEQAARDGATAISLVATALSRIDASLYRVIVLGGSRPPADRPPNTVATYGLTETGSGVVYDGRPLDGVEVRIAPDGEILLRGPMLMRGYRDGTTAIDSAGWLHTGDAGSMQADGTLRVDGRKAELIITGGENVWPDRVEAVLASHPSVAEVAVAGVPDEEWGQRVVAWVVAAPGAAPELDALRDHTRRVLPAFMAPKEVRLVEALPRISVGKVNRRALTTHD